MRVLSGEAWSDDCLDSYRSDDELRIVVARWLVLERLEDVYFVRSRNIGTVIEYVREIGVRETFRKVFSRLAETSRNDKYVACGAGRVLQAPEGGAFAAGDAVSFFAPIAPKCVERIVLPPELVAAAEPFDASSGVAVCLDHTVDTPWWEWARGWTQYSGVPLDGPACEALLQNVETEMRLVDTVRWRRHRWTATTPRERSPGTATASSRKSAVLFGYGNYAKTLVCPPARRSFDLACIHEVDPLQMALRQNRDVTWDSSPVPRADESYDVYFIAGYHHTHAPLAEYALRRGADAVVEKPIAMSEERLSGLLDAMREGTGRLFSCYQKRYQAFNRMIREDLQVSRDDPVSYHCIVYEVPLPRDHWYRWPNSRTRVLSNGCHWIDHFLFLNGFCEVRDSDVAVAGDGTVNCTVTLENGAAFTMALTDRGSSRIGVQDHIEVRANGRTATIVNQSRYRSESSSRKLRSATRNRMDAFKAMYAAILEAIESGTGDSIDSVRVSAALALDLDEKAKSQGLEARVPARSG